jgi:glucose-6-phosphate 1-dehydrogenase
VFGATGDLARRKLSGLFHLAAAGLMPDRYQIIGSSRTPMTDEQFASSPGRRSPNSA